MNEKEPVKAVKYQDPRAAALLERTERMGSHTLISYHVISTRV